MGEDIEARRRRGREWAKARYAAESAPEWVCERCGKRFHRVPLGRRDPRLCSKACADAAKLGVSTRGTVEDRFWRKVDRSGGPDACWLWLGSHHPAGYGRLYWRGKMRPATHVALFLDRGIEVGTGVARHDCDNPPCVNPAHLQIGDQVDNRRDSVERGRAPLGERIGSSRLDAAAVRRIRLLASAGHSHREIGEMVGCHQTTVTRVLLMPLTTVTRASSADVSTRMTIRLLNGTPRSSARWGGE